MERNASRLWQERIESLKAGTVSAIATSGAFGLAVVLNHWLNQPNTGLPRPIGSPLLDQFSSQLAHSLPVVSGANLYLGLGIAAFSGFLFGITYRHLVRTDRDSHLQAGAIGAFGLVRGLAQVDTQFRLRSEWLAGVVLAAESFVMFAIAAFVLDWALRQGIVRPFEGWSE